MLQIELISATINPDTEMGLQVNLHLKVISSLIKRRLEIRVRDSLASDKG